LMKEAGLVVLVKTEPSFIVPALSLNAWQKTPASRTSAFTASLAWTSSVYELAITEIVV
jgi:hypothetical protein